jgi:hypothetical protein
VKQTQLDPDVKEVQSVKGISLTPYLWKRSDPFRRERIQPLGHQQIDYLASSCVNATSNGPRKRFP